MDSKKEKEMRYDSVCKRTFEATKEFFGDLNLVSIFMIKGDNVFFIIKKPEATMDSKTMEDLIKKKTGLYWVDDKSEMLKEEYKKEYSCFSCMACTLKYKIEDVLKKKDTNMGVVASHY